MEDLVRALNIEAVVQRYGFWEREDANPALGEEVERAARSGADVVLAKSIGTLITMLAGGRHGFRPKASVFLGVPVKRLVAEGRVDLLVDQHRQSPTLFIQQTNDPTGSFRDLVALLPAEALERACEVPGNDHAYTDVEALADLIGPWLVDTMKSRDAMDPGF